MPKSAIKSNAYGSLKMFIAIEIWGNPFKLLNRFRPAKTKYFFIDLWNSLPMPWDVVMTSGTNAFKRGIKQIHRAGEVYQWLLKPWWLCGIATSWDYMSLNTSGCVTIWGGLLPSCPAHVASQAIGLALCVTSDGPLVWARRALMKFWWPHDS